MSVKKPMLLLCLSLASVAQCGEQIDYFPPFIIDSKFLISQGFGGASTHQNSINYYAVDLVMPEGAWVCAARDGVVSNVYDGTGFFFNDSKNSNYVRIQHADNQLTDYQHLLLGSIKVHVGQKLKAKQCFAQVGDTGKATGPHLHFAVLEEKNGELISVPFKFIDPNGRTYTPQYLQWVRN